MTDALAELLDGEVTEPTVAPFKIPGMPNKMAPGLYFGLHEADYHADPSLGSGSVRSLAKHPMYYWQDSWMNPLRAPFEETPALLYGRALHSLVLEGSERFSQSYKAYPRKADYPNALDTTKDIQAVLRGLGQKVSGTKPELQDRLRLADPEAQLWDDIVAKFERECAAANATVLKSDVYERVVSAARFIAAEERVRSAFTKGVPEVSIFWEAEGVPLKCRLDYTRLGVNQGKRVGLVTDLKSFANKLEKAPERAVIDAIVHNRLDIQAAQYLDGIAHIGEFIRSGQVYGADKVSPQWLDEIGQLGPNDWRWFWCFYEKDAPIAMLRSTRPNSALISSARSEYHRALDSLRQHVASFGTDWHFVDPIQDPEIDTADLPKFSGA